MSDAANVAMNFPRRDARDKLRGRTRYTVDRCPPGHAARGAGCAPTFRRRASSASILRQRDGCRACARSSPARTHHSANGIGIADHPLFAMRRDRYDGEPIAAIAADTLAQAQAAAAAIAVELEPLPAVISMADALATNAPLFTPSGTTTRFCSKARHAAATSPGKRRSCAATSMPPSRATMSRLSKAVFASAGRTIFRSNHARSSLPMRTAVSISKRRRKSPGRIKNATARFLNVPPSDVRVTVPPVGGGFGLKFDWALEPFAALLTRATGRPVRLVNSRQEEMLTCLCRKRRYPDPLGGYQRRRDRRTRSGRADGLRRLWRRADFPDDDDRSHARRQLPTWRGAPCEPRDLYKHRA